MGACCLVAVLCSSASAFASSPEVSAISPNNGPAKGGTQVTITGSGFLTGATVKFGGAAATGVTVESPSSIKATAPEGSGLVDVSVTDSNSTSAAVASDQFAYDPVLSGPWLGVDGNSADSWTGGLGVFPAHNLLFDSGGEHAEGEGIDFEAGETPSPGDDLERSIDAGMIPVVRIEFDGYFSDPWGSDEKFPHTTTQIEEYAKGFVKTALAVREAYPGKEILFEVMNNAWGYTTPQSNGAEYANVVAKVLPEAKAAGIPLNDIYVFTFGRDLNEHEEWTAGWVPSMYEADPSLETEIQGWSFHPFGPPTGTEENDTGGIEAVPAVRQLMRSGENNIIIGAIGFCAEDVGEGVGCGEGEPDTVDTGTEAAKDLGEVLATARAYHEEGWLKALLVYTRNYGGWSLQLGDGELTKQGEELESFADLVTPHVPEVDSLSPNNGPAKGGTTVTITGNGFGSGASVSFGGTPAAEVTVSSWTSITAKSPPGVGTVDVSVTDAGGTSAHTPVDQFAYDPVRSGPWLGADGNSAAAWTGEIGEFVAHDIPFDSGGEHADGEGIDFEAGETPSPGDDLERSIDAGMIPVVRIEFDGYFSDPWGSDEKFPHTTAQIDAYAKGFVETAQAVRKAYPGKEILFEVMNSPWGYTTPQSNGEEYANVVAKVLPEAKAAGIPLDSVYVYAFGRDLNEHEEWTAGWVPSMYEADPSLETEIQGWSFHPFGPPTGSEENNTKGIESVPNVRELMLSGENNILIGTIGFCAKDVLEGEDCKEDEPEYLETSVEAAKDLEEMLEKARSYREEGWLKALLVYSRHYGGWSLQLPGGELTKQGEALEKFADAEAKPLSNTEAPVISGAAVDGRTLTASTGNWSGSTPISYAYQWESCGPGGGNCEDIEGASGQSYTLDTGDLETTLRVRVTATNPAGAASAVSAASTEVVPGAPFEIEAPSVSGVPREGQTLSAQPGSWTGAETEYRYQWESCSPTGTECADVQGATGAEYPLTAGDTEDTLRVRVGASNERGSVTSVSEVTPVIQETGTLENTAAPALSGSAHVGQTIDVSQGSWVGSEPIEYAYKWQRCDAFGGECEEIEGQSEASYVLHEDDAGYVIQAVVTVTDTNGSTSMTASTVQPVASQHGPTPGETGPSISGTLVKGSTLSLAGGEWEKEGTTTYSYQWMRCDESGDLCTSIEGATESTYTLSEAEIGGTLRVKETASDAGGSSVAVSAATATISPLGPLNVSAPSIGGTEVVGKTLQADPGIWTGEGDIAFTYEWERCNLAGEACVEIPEATEASYTPTSSDLGHRLRVVVTATSAERKASASSPSTSSVYEEPRAPENTDSPSVNGAPTVGQTLTIGHGSWSGSEPITYSYQWQLCKEGDECVAIEGATAETYELVGGDIGSSVRVVVTATNLAGTSKAMSSLTQVIGAAGPPVAQGGGPSINGDTQVGQQVSAENGGWSGSRPLKFNYQWKRCNASGEECASIEGATSLDYTITVADENETLRLAVTATNTLGSAVAISDAVAVAPEGQTSTTPAVEAAEASNPSILAPAESAYVEEQTVKPQIANSEEAIAASDELTSSTASKETPGEFGVNTPAGEMSLMPVGTSLSATMTPTIVNGSVAAYGGTYTDTNTFVRPTPLGATTLLQISSSKAPKSFSWEVGIGSDQQLEKLPDGDIAVVEPTAGPDLEGELPTEAFEATESESAETPEGAGEEEQAAEEGLEGGLGEEHLLEKLPAAPEVTTPPITPGEDELHPQDTDEQYQKASSSMQSAQDQTANTTIMVIEAPQVLDASGNAIPAELSTQGDTVTLTLTPDETTSYPATAEIAVAAATNVTSASKAHVALHGLSDQRASAFDSPEKGTEPAHEFDPLLRSGPLKVSRARIVIPWEEGETETELGHRTSPEEPKWIEWLEAVGKAKLAPYITLGVCWTKTPCKVPSVEEYKKWATSFMKAYVNGNPHHNIPAVRFWGSWNEPVGSLTAKGHTVRPEEAAKMWGAMEIAARNASCLHSCDIVAGEFSEFGKKAVSRKFITKYEEYIRYEQREHKFAVTVKPRFWGIHDYNDIEDQKDVLQDKKWIVKKYNNPEAQGYIEVTKRNFKSAHIWLSEQGVRLALASGPLTNKLYGNEEAQRLAADDFLHLASNREIEWEYYYEYRAPANEMEEFDSALLKHSGEAPDDYRPAYCVLVLAREFCVPPKSETGKSIADSISATAGQVAVTVDPEGAPTKYWVEYGTTTGYGHVTSPLSVPSTNGTQSESVSLTGLESCTTYHYQVEAESEANMEKPSLGGDQTLTTACPAVAVSAGWQHACAALADGHAACWGADESGDLGSGSFEGPEECRGVSHGCSWTPVYVQGITNAISVAAGWYQSCALLSGGEVDCWGEGVGGESAGQETTARPVPIVGVKNATAITVGLDYGCALIEGGTVECWGYNVDGKLGDGSEESSIDYATGMVHAVAVTGITNAVAISANTGHACAVLATGHVDCWGQNMDAVLGDGTYTGPEECGDEACSRVPATVDDISDAVAVGSGVHHTCAVLSTSEVSCWGENGWGQLGNGEDRGPEECSFSNCSMTPVHTEGLDGVVAVSGGDSDTCALLLGGSVECWGAGGFGQLGAGPFVFNSLNPVAVTGMGDAEAISLGGEFSCALLTGGAVDCWGYNAHGELGGHKSERESFTPVSVVGIG